MQRFWEAVIEPVLDAVQPKVVVEIGSGQGDNTVNLLEYCGRTDATLHVIDPAPRYNVSEWQDKHDEHLVFHEDLSLNALPSIEAFDVVLIDGDHNWYTVFNELRTIERLCDERGREFPLVLLHDIGWPYGRRDLYYDPDSIPEEHRKPHEKKGMLPGVPDLVEEGGMNSHLSNALRENEPMSGVLTAVEDFLDASRYELDLLELPGIHGIGILTPMPLKQENSDLARLLDKMNFSPFFAHYVDGVERARLESQIEQQEAQHELNLAKGDVLQLSEWLHDLDDGFSVLLRSRRWRVSSAAIALYRKATFRGSKVAVDGSIENILRKYRTWRKEKARQDRDPKGEGIG